MSDEVPNGTAPYALTVLYNPDTQSVEVQFEAAQFRTWEFILGVLEMAKLTATAKRQMSQMVAMQQQAAEAQMANAVKRSLIRH